MSATLRLAAPTAPIRATLRPPGSKSLSNRALLLAAMAEGQTRIDGCLDAEDTQWMLACLERLGVVVTRVGEAIADGLELRGGPGLGTATGELRLEVGTAGTVARFMTAALASAQSPSWSAVVIDGSPRMRERPMDTLLEALVILGAQLEPLGKPGALPVRLHAGAGLAGGTLVLERPASSQFVSALLIAGCLATAPIEIILREGTPARPYVDMTLATIAAFGGNAMWSEFVDPGGSRPGSGEERLLVEPSTLRGCPRYVVEPDASAASYLLSLPVLWGGEVTIRELGASSLQGDAAFYRVLEGFGAQVEQGPDFTTVRGPEAGTLRGQTLDLRDMPDMTLTAAVVALACVGPTRITGVDVLRHHESDRLAAGAAELRKLGAEVVELDDGLEIVPPAGGLAGITRDVTIETYKDHRMAMAFAMLGDVAIADPRCVDKTYPDYFEVLAGLGIGARR
jgi:3-phosphoshikimate 1-carboxyvinyltransferase